MRPNSSASLLIIWLCPIFGCIGCGGRTVEPPPKQLDALRAGTPGHDQPERLIAYAARPAPAPVYAKDVAPLFEKYCVNCHDVASAEGGVVLENLLEPMNENLRSLLHRVAQNLRSESMPPEGEPRPLESELEIISAWIASRNKNGRARNRKSGAAPSQSREYNNTIRDLIGLDLRPADEFPSDDVGYGFDNIGEVLSTSPILVEMYLAAAERTVDAVFQSSERRATIMNPPADFMPSVFRRYTPPVRTPRENKVLRTTPIAADPELVRQQKIYDILRAFADRAYRRPATHDELVRLLEYRDLGRKGR